VIRPITGKPYVRAVAHRIEGRFQQPIMRTNRHTLITVVLPHLDNRRGNKADHISRCLVEERAQADRGDLRLRQGEPHFSFAQLFFDLVEEVAALEASVAHRKS